MVPVLHALHLLEEGQGLALVEGLAGVGAEGHVHHVVAGLGGLLQPLLEGGPLDVVGGPVGGLDLRLDDVELAVDPERGGDVAGGGAHAPGQHGVQPVQTQDPEEVAAAHVRVLDRLVVLGVARLDAVACVDREDDKM